MSNMQSGTENQMKDMLMLPIKIMTTGCIPNIVEMFRIQFSISIFQ
jgi:hypothetical protein